MKQHIWDLDPKIGEDVLKEGREDVEYNSIETLEWWKGCVSYSGEEDLKKFRDTRKQDIEYKDLET